MKVFYVYKTINTVNKKFYIGYHRGYPNDVEWYKGSGKLLNRAIEKYGINKFITGIIKIFNSKEEALNYEKELVNYDLINNRDCYNVSLGGSGGGFFTTDNNGIMTYPSLGKSCFTDTLGNIYHLDVNSTTIKELNLTQLVKGKSQYTNGLINIMMTKDDPRVLSGEYYSISKNKAIYTNGKLNIRLSPNDPRVLSGEFTHIDKGRTHKQTTCPYCGKVGGINCMSRWHFDNCKHKAS